ncbi:MAG: tetratricopeptide repeat protein [Pseudomonadota bacterium]|nr:tetratricopeptide repeat protein [Pseudomonadota bacterium]
MALSHLVMAAAAAAQLQVAPVATEHSQLESGITAYESQQYDQARALLEPLAESGVTEAQYFMGVMHWYGAGVDLSALEAQRWFSRAVKSWLSAAQAGDLDAMVEMSLMNRNGFGVDRNDTEALRWTELALQRNANFARAVSLMGDHYLDGIGLPANRTTAIEWYRKAADLGDPWGQMMLERLDQ